MRLKFEYEPLPVFVPFHTSTERERSVFGGYGSGKSTAGCGEAIALGLEQPGSEILVTRKTVPALRDTTEKIFVSLLPPDFFKACDVARAGGHLEHVTFPNGSIFYFRGMDDWRKLRSMNLAFIFWDEADEFTPEDIEGMSSRLRQTKPTPAAKELGFTSIDRRGHIFASNPQGKNFLWQRFVNEHTRSPNTAYWTSSSLDNPFLPLDYIESLLSMPDPWVRRYVLCSFDDFAGQIYESWGWDTHVIHPYMSYAANSFLLMGMDPGTSKENPTAGLWCYYDQDRHWLVGVAEYQEHSLSAKMHAGRWRAIESKFGLCKVRQRIADPTVTTRDRGSNNRLSDQYQRAGYNFELGPKREKDRIPMLGQLIEDGRFRVTSDCPRTFEAIQNYRWKDLTPRQREEGADQHPIKKDDHLVNCAQYITSKYIPPPRITPLPEALAGATPDEQRVAEHNAQIRAAIRKQLEAKQTRTVGNDLGMLSV
jgi:PBSX family phage terminase large subunit